MFQEPGSFSTCTMITVCSVSAALRWRRSAAKARASVSRLAAAKGERISWPRPAESCARGKRTGSSFTQAGA